MDIVYAAKAKGAGCRAAGCLRTGDPVIRQEVLKKEGNVYEYSVDHLYRDLRAYSC